MTSPKNLGQWMPGAWEHVVGLDYTGEPILIGGGTVTLKPPRPKPRPRRYHPSLIAHRPPR